MPLTESGRASGGNETILIVEDEETLLELVKGILEEKGYKVLGATDGEEAVDIYLKHKDEIAVVLSDMGLPKMGGWEAFLKMKEINPNLRSILASGYVDPKLKVEMLKAGAVDFIQKPYDPDEIINRIREVIDASKGSSEYS